MKSFKRYILNYIIEFLLALVVLFGTIDNTREIIIFQNYANFINGSVLLLMVLVVYLFFWFSHRSRKLELNLVFDDEVNEVGVVLNKLIIPIAFYIAIVWYAHYNITSGLLMYVYAIQFFAFYIYFVNVKAFFTRDLHREHRTDIVYDIFKFILFFLSIDIIANLTRDFSISTFVASTSVFFLSFIMITLMILRMRKTRRLYYLIALVISLVISLVFLSMITFSNLNFVLLSFLMLIVFYVLNALFFHWAQGTLSKSVTLEYCAVLTLIFAFLTII